MKQKIEIINVIEITKGITETPFSFVIINGVNRDKIVAKAEKFFIERAKKIGMEKDEADECLENGNYDNMNGGEVIINWSNVKK